MNQSNQHSTVADQYSQTATAWHTQSQEDVIEALASRRQGLTEAEAAERLLRTGPNRLPEPAQRTAWQRFLQQFHNLLIYVLMFAGALTAALSHWIDAGVIFGVVLINAIIGFVQEGKADDAMRAIRQMLSSSAMVLRAGQQKTIDAEQLVPGDIVLLQPGDKVPADLRLLQVRDLQIQESALTGESVAVEKQVEPVAPQATIGDRLNMAYSGTLVTHGQASGIVVATGRDSEIGRINAMVSQVKSLSTPLLRQMDQFARWLTLAILLLAIVTFSFGLLLRGYGAVEMFLAAVSLAVAAIPEGLPAILTITLAIGVQRMAGRNAIIRRLPAVETLGAVNVICSDKTGTLTRNEMMVSQLVCADAQYQFSGAGYDPHGVISLDGSSTPGPDDQLLAQILRAAILCNDAAIEPLDQQWRVHGDPMEGALLVAGLKGGLEFTQIQQQFPRTDLIPFESAHQFMATLHHSHDGDAFIILKGAPERLLERCAHEKTGHAERPLQREYWEQSVERLASRGQRVLGIAIKTLQQEQSELEYDDVEQGFTLLGLFGLIDPPREEAISAIHRCHSAGIRVKMITGDHAATARAIAKQLNLHNSQDTLTGAQIDQMSEQALSQRVLDVDVYARVSPEHKLLLVRLMQQHQQVVAMTGDGVNDAPALKRADVGIAMGLNGTEAAREAAEMVLADDNFASIAHAVEEGRTVYDNIKKAILFILPTNGGEALIILAAIVFGFEHLPLTAVQILWVNMVTAVTLALSLAFEPAEKNVMQRPPRNSREALLSRHLIWRIAFVSLILMTGTFGLFMWEIERGMSIEHARTVAVNTLVMFEIFYLFNARYIYQAVFQPGGLLGNRYVIIAIALLLLFQWGFTYLTPLQILFGTSAISWDVWLRIGLVASSVLFLVELEKALLRYRLRHKASS